jgi:TPR repeat protein
MQIPLESDILLSEDKSKHLACLLESYQLMANPQDADDAAEGLRRMRIFADGGNPFANYALYGFLLDADQAEALERLRRAAELGFPEAQCVLGQRLRHGSGTPQDLNQARHWLGLAYGQGHPLAAYGLGAMTLMGQGGPKNAALAAKMFEFVAQSGIPEGWFVLSNMRAMGDGLPQDDKAAAEMMRRAADLGYSQAELMMGKYYLEGFGVEADNDLAAMWLKRAEAQGRLEATLALAMMERGPDGQFLDERKTFQAVLGLAEKGLPEAQFYAGHFYRDGMGVQRDMSKHFQWVKASADGGYVEAQLLVGGLLGIGAAGAPRDKAESARYLRLAAKEGHPTAWHVLGETLLDGQGLPADTLEALECYRRSAELGSPLAQRRLGSLYEGQGGHLPKDLAQAAYYYRLAAMAGDRGAQKRLDELCAQDPALEAASKARLAKKAKRRQPRWTFVDMDADAQRPPERDSPDSPDSPGGDILSLALREIALAGLKPPICARPKSPGGAAPSSAPREMTPEECQRLSLGRLRQAAQGGSLEAQRQYGLRLLQQRFPAGQRGLKEEAAALEWIVAAADSGHGEAQFDLYRIYQSGHGRAIKKDRSLSRTYLRLAAKGGHAKARKIVEGLLE